MAPFDPSDDDDVPGTTTAPWMRNGGYAAPPADDDQEIWLLSYSDLVTLLFSVFVMLMAITSVKDQLPKDTPPDTPVKEEVQVQPVPAPEAKAESEAKAEPEAAPAPADIPPPDPRPRLNPDEVAVEAPEPLSLRWQETLAALGLPPGVAVHVQQNRVSIDIGAAILFASGQADVSAEGKAVLARLAPLLLETSGRVAVEGHTDSVPVTSGRFPSNWELSAARAAAVVRSLIDQRVSPSRLSAVGFADTRPLTPGTDPASLARNRRVTLSLVPLDTSANHR